MRRIYFYTITLFLLLINYYLMVNLTPTHAGWTPAPELIIDEPPECNLSRKLSKNLI